MPVVRRTPIVNPVFPLKFGAPALEELAVLDLVEPLGTRRRRENVIQMALRRMNSE
jgi:hypothetical protein